MCLMTRAILRLAFLNCQPPKYGDTNLTHVALILKEDIDYANEYEKSCGNDFMKSNALASIHMCAYIADCWDSRA